MKYTWRPANGLDVKPIVDMAVEHFLIETDGIFTPEPVIYQRNLTLAVINQFYGPLTQLVSIAVDEEDRLLAYTWATRGERAVWSVVCSTQCACNGVRGTRANLTRCAMTRSPQRGIGRGEVYETGTVFSFCVSGLFWMIHTQSL